MAAKEAREQAGQMASQARGRAQEMGGYTGKKADGMFKKLKEIKPRGPAGWVALIAVAAAVVVGAAIALTLLAPILLFFSPILVPVGIVLFLCTAGIVTAGSTGVAISWLYRYFTGRRPQGSERLDHMKGQVHETLEHMKHRAQDMAPQGLGEEAGEMGGQARDQAGRMGGKPREMGGQAPGMMQRLKRHRPGPAGWLAIIALACALAIGSAVVLTVLSPVLLFLSPILVPAGIVLFLCTAGIVTAGGAGLATLSAVSWLYRYVKGKHPRGSDQLDQVMGRVHETTEHVKHRARDMTGQIPTPTGA